jgi:23S rRNA pseudouridine2605 synthase
MPPRFAYWTIILDDAPTSFRTKEREEILPLFNQLKAKNPSALLKWFSGGKLWDSPEQAREARELEKVRQFREDRAREKSERPFSPGSLPRPGSGQADPGSPKADEESGDASREDPLAEFRRQHGRPADGSDDPSLRAQGERRPPSPSGLPAGPGAASKARGERRERIPGRGKDWRPGGEHRDPADKYKLPPGEARKRWKERNLGPRGPKPFGSKPGGDRPWSDRPRGPKPFGSKPGGNRRWSPGPSPRPGSGQAAPGARRGRGKPPGGSRGKY